MKKIEINKMNSKQRLSYAEMMVKFYGRMTLIDMIDGYRYNLKSDSKNFKTWYKVTMNMFAMRGIKFISKYNLLM